MLCSHNFPFAQDGVVKLWHADCSWGFVKPARGGSDVYIHSDNVAGKKTLSVGQRVAFYTGPSYSGQGVMAMGCYPVSTQQISPLFEFPQDAKVVLGKDLPDLRDHGCFLPMCKSSNGGCIRPMGRYVFMSIRDPDAFSTPLRSSVSESAKRDEGEENPTNKYCNPRFRGQESIEEE